MKENGKTCLHLQVMAPNSHTSTLMLLKLYATLMKIEFLLLPIIEGSLKYLPVPRKAHQENLQGCFDYG